MGAYDRDYRRVHAAYTVDSLPRAVVGRVIGAQRDLWGGSAWRPPLLLFFLVGLAALDRRGWLAMAWAPALLLVYLVYAHPPQWGVYYHEAHPVLAFATALGLWRALAWLATGSCPGGSLAGSAATQAKPGPGATLELLRPDRPTPAQRDVPGLF
jgi:hypothetical protein